MRFSLNYVFSLFSTNHASSEITQFFVGSTHISGVLLGSEQHCVQTANLFWAAVAKSDGHPMMLLRTIKKPAL